VNTTELREELALLMPARACCQRRELQALSIGLDAHADSAALSLRTPLNAVARKLVRLARAAGVVRTEFHKGSSPVRPRYAVRLVAPTDLVAELLRASPPERPCCRRAFLRGAFLGTGSLMAPHRGYHLEFVLRSPGAAAAVASVLGTFELTPGRYQRRGRWVVYLKGAEAIAHCLSAIGVSRGLLEFQGFRVVQEVRAGVNRRTNTETANLNKSIRAAMEQARQVRRMEADGHLGRLPPALREAAALRLMHPRAGLVELAGRAGLSKSAMNGRLRRLAAWADGLPGTPE
jgi:DNA-binding protein WhiA